jgi:5'-nucleotidase
MVISGINVGANMGDDTIYSGTVAAATEGYLLGVPSLAVSLTSHKCGLHFETAPQVTRRLVERFFGIPPRRAGLAQRQCAGHRARSPAGIRVTRLGKRHKAEGVVKQVNPRGETVYWVGAAGLAQDAGEGTDFHAVENGFASLTPLQIDLTHAARSALSTAGYRHEA